MTPRAPFALLLALLATTGLTACGIDTEQEGKPNPEVSRTPGEPSTIDSEKTERLPKRPDGVVAVEGPVQGSLTPQAITGVSGVRVNYAPQDSTTGFRDLCEGKIDILDTSRQISPAEQRLCARNGVDLAGAIQVASDAVVIATPNEHDIGGDCLRMSTVNDIFRAGSPLNNWNQVGFFNIPLYVTGGDARNPAFQFFAQRALGVETNATLDDVRSDYILRPTDDGIRREVTSAARLERVRNRFRGRLKNARERRDISFQLEVDRAISDARARMLAKFEEEADRLAATEAVLTEAQKDAIERRNRRRIEAAIRTAQERAIARFSYPRLRVLRSRYRAALNRERRLGTIGIFRFSYYELYEQELRPMEIWDPERAAVALDAMNGVNAREPEPEPTTTTATTATGTTPTSATTATTPTTPTVEQEEDGDVVVDPEQTPWCVFPSQQTITNQSYPLSRPFLLYVSKFNLAREEVQEFLRSYVERARELARANRLVPIPEAVQETNNNIIDLDRTPGVVDDNDATTTSTTETTTTSTGPLPGVGQGATTTPTTTTTAP